jgi:hypothetical protein
MKDDLGFALKVLFVVAVIAAVYLVAYLLIRWRAH